MFDSVEIGELCLVRDYIRKIIAVKNWLIINSNDLENEFTEINAVENFREKK